MCTNDGAYFFGLRVIALRQPGFKFGNSTDKKHISADTGVIHLAATGAKRVQIKDARDYQIIFLTLFLVLGVAMREWSLRPEMVGAAVMTALGVQFAIAALIEKAGVTLGQWTGYQPTFKWPSMNWRSPLITALGLSLLLRTDHIATMALAAGCAIASKFLFKTNNKHFFNPANFGIIAALVLTHDAWVSPGQWGQDMWYAFVFLGAGGIVLKRVGRWDTTGMFLASYALLEAIRNLYLGWTWDVWAHRMMSGSLLLFALFMVTDPRSIPNARPARLMWTGAIALLTFILRNQFYTTTAVFWALFLLAPLTILLDKAWTAPRFEWRKLSIPKSIPKIATSLSVLFCVFFFSFAQSAYAFCGFYVARADTELYNKASQVAIARDGNHTVLTMANDFQGDVADFAMVIPVPTVIEREQVDVAEPAVLERLDEFSAPRLVEYFDSDPCEAPTYLELGSTIQRSARGQVPEVAAPAGSDALGVTIEEQFSVGEYDILILSATQSDGLATWLRQNDYRLPDGASEILAPYIRQDMKFFVAKVNLEEFEEGEFQRLRPLQVEYDSPRFMLPIRLGMLNAEAEQDLVVYLLSPQGRAELTNYRTVNIPTDAELPLFVQEEFGSFYPDMFQHSYEAANKEVAFLEYAWDTRGCDPCSAMPLSPKELRDAGAFWTDPNYQQGSFGIGRGPKPNNMGAFVTRLHVRYSRDKFPEDLMFQSTSNRRFFQGRYITRHPFSGNIDCAARFDRERTDRDARETSDRRIAQPPVPDTIENATARGEAYNKALAERFEREARTLATLTGKPVGPIRQRISNEVPQPMPSQWLVMHPKGEMNGRPRPLGWSR